MAHQLEGNKDRQYSLFDVGRCLIMGCICSSYIDKIEKIDEELLWTGVSQIWIGWK